MLFFYKEEVGRVLSSPPPEDLHFLMFLLIIISLNAYNANKDNVAEDRDHT